MFGKSRPGSGRPEDQNGRRRRCGTCHKSLVSGRWSAVRPCIYRILFTFHCSPFTKMWHVPHLKQAAFSRAEMALRERAFGIRGTRFCRFVARFDRGKIGPILGQNDTHSTHSDHYPPHPAYPAPPDPSPRRSCRILHRPTPFGLYSSNI